MNSNTLQDREEKTIASNAERVVSAVGRPDLSSCLPRLPELDWNLLARTPFVFVGTGAVNRPLAVNLAWLGMRRSVLADPKPYKPQSVVSQCRPHEVDRAKAEVVAEELAELGVKAVPLVEDIEAVPPGHVQPDTVIVAGVDNRRADIIANRLAVRMRCRLVKVNVEPSYLLASIRSYDFRSEEIEVCLECQMNDDQYDNQLHPLSCDADAALAPTGSPRALCQFAANAAALAVAQIVCSPKLWAKEWLGRQWQQTLLGGRGCFSELSANSQCRFDHTSRWENLQRLSTGPWKTTLADLIDQSSTTADEDIRLHFSARVATRARCNRCHQQLDLIRWVSWLETPIERCSCGGTLKAMPFFTFDNLPACRLKAVWERPLAEWGVSAFSLIGVATAGDRRSFVVSKDG